MLKIGKLDNDLLKKIVFDKITYKRPEVLARPGIGEDCAVLDFGEYECAVSSDPITAAISQIGSLAVNISCNDVASNGVVPMAMIMTALFPAGTTEDDIEDVMEQAGAAAAELEVEIAGGHTEITDTVARPVIVSTVLGRCVKGTGADARNMVPGDYILMTKTAGIEGTGLIACDHEEKIADMFSTDELKFAKALLSCVSVVSEGIIAGCAGTHGMHDITEGGVLGAVWEMCRAGGTGAEVYTDEIPVLAVTVKICARLGLDPLRLISSGSMLIIAPERTRDMIEGSLAEENIRVTCIGRILPQEDGIRDREGNEIAPPAEDEIYKVTSGR